MSNANFSDWQPDQNDGPKDFWSYGTGHGSTHPIELAEDDPTHRLTLSEAAHEALAHDAWADTIGGVGYVYCISKKMWLHPGSIPCYRNNVPGTTLKDVVAELRQDLEKLL